VCRGYLRDRNGRYITSREIRTRRNALPENELRNYLQRRNDWSNETYNTINWSAYSSAIAGLSDNARTFVVKLTPHIWLPKRVRERRCSVTSDLCRHCNEVETVPHLYRCQSRETWRQRFLTHLPGHLIETKTAADIRCIITKGIESWFLNGATKDPYSMIETVVRIGWFQMLTGYTYAFPMSGLGFTARGLASIEDYVKSRTINNRRVAVVDEETAHRVVPLMDAQTASRLYGGKIGVQLRIHYLFFVYE
jgi:hypothetical protein